MAAGWAPEVGTGEDPMNAAALAVFDAINAAALAVVDSDMAGSAKKISYQAFVGASRGVVRGGCGPPHTRHPRKLEIPTKNPL